MDAGEDILQSLGITEKIFSTANLRKKLIYLQKSTQIDRSNHGFGFPTADSVEILRSVMELEIDLDLNGGSISKSRL